MGIHLSVNVEERRVKKCVFLIDGEISERK